MSDTESFEYALWKAIDDCKIDESTDTITGSYTKSLSNQDRVVAAHIREIRDTAQQEYSRGYHDGQHSMDAEHRAIAMRLRGLRFDGGSHENLARIAYAIYPCATGWTCESADGLRDRLVDLMGGVSEPTFADQALDLMNTIIKESNECLQNDGKAEKPSNTEVGDDTYDSQCRGACAAGDGRDSGEHAEVSDDCVDCDILGPDSRGHAVGCDFHEFGVSDGRTSHDSAADSRGGSRGELVHMDGLEPTATVTGDGLTITSEDGDELRIAKDDILLNGKSIVKDSIDGFLGLTATYDVLDNERRKAVCELRKMTIDSDYHGNYQRIALAIGTVYDGESFASECVRDRLIHLLGGDQPSGIDVLRAMDDGHSRTCPKSDEEMSESAPSVSITDELRECVSTASKSYDNTPWYDMDEGEEADHTTCHITEGELLRIADRIDEQFNRICQQQEAVLQSIIDEVIEERKSDRLRIEKLERQRDEARAKLDAIRGMLDG